MLPIDEDRQNREMSVCVSFELCGTTMGKQNENDSFLHTIHRCHHFLYVVHNIHPLYDIGVRKTTI